MMIRGERDQDCDAIAAVTALAFAGTAHGVHGEPAIVAALRAARAIRLSLVAVQDGAIIGHIAFSPVTIAGHDHAWFGLGPLSVRPDRQRRGVGGALVCGGLDRLRTLGAAGCVVLGDPAYYRRFGFENDGALRYEGAPPEFFLRSAFGPDVPRGRVEYHPAFYGH